MKAIWIKRALPAALVALVLATGWWARARKAEPRQSGPVTADAATPASAVASGSTFQPLNKTTEPAVAPGLDPAAQLRALDPASIGGQKKLTELLQSMSRAELIAALEALWSDRAFTRASQEICRQLLARWAETGPAQAASWISARPASAAKSTAALHIATVWANQSLSEAAQWVRGWPEGEKERGLLAIAYEASRSTPMEALRIASELPADADRDGLIQHAVGQWVNTDSGASLTWAGKIPASPLREQVFASLAVALAEREPAVSAKLALEELPPGRKQSDAVVSVVQRWAQSEPATAASWVAQFPAGPLKQSAVEQLVQLWAEQNPQQALDWAENLDPLTRDHALAVLSARIAPQDAETSKLILGAIADPAKRESEMQLLVERLAEAERPE